MEIDDVIWLDDIVEKIATKQASRRARWKKYCSPIPSFGAEEKANEKEKTCTTRWARRMRVDTCSSCSSASAAIGHWF